MLLMILFEMPVAHPQVVSCSTSVSAGTPSGINPAPSTGAVSGYGLTNSYMVYYCDCLSTQQGYLVSESGVSTIAQDCPESAACYIITNTQDTVCPPTFDAPTSTADNWSVVTTPYTMDASTQACTDGDGITMCSNPYWEFSTCLAQTPTLHVYTAPSMSGCSGGCTTDSDCPGGLVCLSGACGCSTPCDDPSCPGYDPTSLRRRRGRRW